MPVNFISGYSEGKFGTGWATMTDTDEKPRKKMGRPPKMPEKGKRQNYTFRMSDSTRDQVTAAAAVSGRSVSEEIERRVEGSFETAHMDMVISAFLDGGVISAIAKDLAAATKRVDPPSVAGSYEPYRRALLKAVERILASHLPDQPSFAPRVDRTPAWEASCKRAEIFGDLIGQQVLASAWDALTQKLARDQADLPAPSPEEIAVWIDSPGLMGEWARSEARKQKENG